MINISDVATQLNICKTMTIVLQNFYQRTKISGKLSFSYNPELKGMELDLAFSPRQPTEAEYSILFEELFDVEQLLLNQYIVNNTHHYENIKQFHSKHDEEMKQIIEKHRELK